MKIKNPNKKSVWFPDDVLPIVGNPKTGYAARVVGMVRAYGQIVKAHTPALQESEWLFLCEVLGEEEVREDTALNLAQIIQKKASDLKPTSKWDAEALVVPKRVEQMDLPARYAILEVVFRFWEGTGIVSDYRQKLIGCGARLEE